MAVIKGSLEDMVGLSDHFVFFSPSCLSPLARRKERESVAFPQQICQRAKTWNRCRHAASAF